VISQSSVQCLPFQSCNCSCIHSSQAGLIQPYQQSTQNY